MHLGYFYTILGGFIMYLDIELYHSRFISKSCPNCHKPLEKISKRKFICPNCKKDVYYRSVKQSQTELLLSSDEIEIFEFYRDSTYEFNNESTIRSMLHGDLYPDELFVDNTPSHLITSTFIPIILKQKSKNLKNKELDYMLTHFILWDISMHLIMIMTPPLIILLLEHIYLLMGSKNGMKSLDLNSLPLKDEYSYLSYKDLTHIFFLKHPEWPLNFSLLEECYYAISLESKITYRYSTQETFSMIKDLIKKFV